MKNQATYENFKKHLVEFLIQDIEKCCYFKNAKINVNNDSFEIEVVPEYAMEHQYLYIEYDGLNLKVFSDHFESFSMGYEYLEELKDRYDIRPR